MDEVGGQWPRHPSLRQVVGSEGWAAAGAQKAKLAQCRLYPLTTPAVHGPAAPLCSPDANGTARVSLRAGVSLFMWPWGRCGFAVAAKGQGLGPYRSETIKL